MEHDELLPCPFCGGEAYLVKSALAPDVFANCEECEATSDYFFSDPEAVAAWNRRAT